MHKRAVFRNIDGQHLFKAGSRTQQFLGQLFDGNYVPGDVIGFSVKNLDKAYNKGYNTFGGNWGFAVGALNAGMQILGGLSAIYTLGSGSIGLETKKGTLPTL